MAMLVAFHRRCAITVKAVILPGLVFGRNPACAPHQVQQPATSGEVGRVVVIVAIGA